MEANYKQEPKGSLREKIRKLLGSSSQKPSSQINNKSFKHTVKHEVDMALALSAQEIAWSRFLHYKLLSSPDEDSKIIERASHKQDGEEGEAAEIKKRLEELQKLSPGGEEMNIEEMLSEIGSYIVCLEM